jgi:predicted aspartyl protease
VRSFQQQFTQLYDKNGQLIDSWAPLLMVTLVGTNRVRLRMLVDSGSTETLIGETLARAVGLMVTNTEVELTGMGGSRAIGRVASATIEYGLGRFSFKSRVVVAPDFEEHHALLGIRDFFLRHRVTFDASERWFSIAPRN